MSTTQPIILISNKTEGGYDTLCGNHVAEELIDDQERLVKIFASLGYTAMRNEIVPGSLHLRIKPPFIRGADVEIALSACGINTVVSGHEADDLEAQDAVVLFLPKHLAETCLKNEIEQALSASGPAFTHTHKGHEA